MYRDLLLVVLVIMFVRRNTVTAQLENTSPNDSEPDVAAVQLKLLVVLPLHTQPYIRTSNKDKAAAGGGVIKKHALLPRWDRGLEILPAAYVAAEQINGLSSLFHGLRVEVVPVNSSQCDNPVGSESYALATFTKEVTKLRQKGQCLMGVAGLFCEASTLLLFSTNSLSHISLLHLSGSASPIFQLQNGNTYPFLYQMIASTKMYCDATYALMKFLSWNRIAIVGDMFIKAYYSSTANQCYKHFNKQNITVSFFGVVASRDNTISEILTSLRASSFRISLLSTTVEMAANILCFAYENGMRWPQYTWIIYDHTPSDLLAHLTACDADTMSIVLEKAILMRYDLKISKPSGRFEQMVRDYEVTYDNSLREMEIAKGLAFGSLQRNEYANVLYDSVLSFAVAFNSSRSSSCSNSDSQQQNFDLENAHKQLDGLSILGASGVIKFNSNQVNTPVILYHYRGTYEVSIGYYYKGNFSALNLDVQGFPRDDFPRQYILMSSPVGIFLIAIVFFFFLTCTATLVLFLTFRSEPEIKATSPFLSLNIFIGTYILLLGSLVLVLNNSTVITLSEAARNVLCVLYAWCNLLGMNFVFATLLVRMFRIWYIFEINKFGRMGKMWSDWTLLGAIVIIVGIPFTFLLIWLALDPYFVVKFEVFVPNANHYEVFKFCDSKHMPLWAGLIFGELFLLTISVATLAVLTRKIKRHNFNDTKKVSVCVLMMIAILCLAVPLWFTLTLTNNIIARSILCYAVFAAMSVTCQIFLFIPKIYPVLLRKILAFANDHNMNITMISSLITSQSSSHDLY